MAASASGPSETASFTRAGGLRQPRLWLFLSGALLLVAATVAALLQPPHPDAWRVAPGWLSLDFWRWPLERNAFMRLPRISANINALHLADDGRIWLATGAGEILHGSADGMRWVRQWPPDEASAGTAPKTARSALPGIADAAAQGLPAGNGKQYAPPAGSDTGQVPDTAARPLPPPARPALRALHFLPDGRHGWAVGESGTILAGADGGDTWTPQASGTDKYLIAVHFTADGRRGWAVGADGTILASTDGGDTWTPQASGTEKDLVAVHFTADGRRGWAVGGGGTILVSTDGGDTWSPRNSSTRENLLDVRFTADGQRGWAVGTNGTILVSTDGGDTWSPRTSGTREGLNAVYFTADGRRGLAVGGNGTLLASANGGDTWMRRFSGTGENLHTVRFTAGGQRGWVIGTNGTLLASNDGGDSWMRGASGTGEPLFAVHFTAGGRRGWAVGTNGTLLASTDGGSAWTPQFSGPETLTALHFTADGQRGWAVGSRGTFLASTDGGNTWTPRDSGTGEWLAAVQFTVDGQRGWVVGASGTIRVSTDGGDTWASRISGTGEWLAAVQFTADGRRGWAVGDNGTIRVSTDGGDTWTQRTSGTDKHLRAVHFTADGQRGWAVGHNGMLLVSTDGGDTWTQRTSGTDKHLRAVHFTADSQRGWVVGGNGTLLASTDSGDTWTLKQSNTRKNLTAVHFAADGQHGWIVGAGPTLLATDDGGQTWRGGELNTDPALRDWPAYARYPAPWLYLGWAAGVGLLALAGRRPPAEYAPQPSIGDAPASDKPLEPGAADTLAFGPLARGLAYFLRNEHTRPPLTVAITGNWGTGKSSLMNLLRGELERHGVRSVWFNAWHHQKEEHLLAALVDGIRRQAIPSALTPDGLRFRARLLWLRSGQQWPWALLVVLLACWSGGYFLKDFPQRFERAWALAQQVATELAAKDGDNKNNAKGDEAKSDGAKGGDSAGEVSSAGPGQPVPAPAAANPVAANPPSPAVPPAVPSARTAPPVGTAALAQGLAALLAAFTALAAILKAMRAFGVKPEALLASLATRTRMSDLGAQTSFRYRYQQEFAEVTQALAPRTMLILIDDLDRCQPAHVLEVLEAVNFLVSSGDCFIVLGIDKEKVQGALGLAFKDLAQEMIDQTVAAAPGKQSDEERARGKRQRYARDYLEKLINLEVPVPLLDAADPARSRGVLAGADAAHEQAGRRVRAWRTRLETVVRTFAAMALFGSAAAGGLYLAGVTPEPPIPLAPAASAAPAGAGGSVATSGRDLPGSRPRPDDSTPPPPVETAPSVPGQTAAPPLLACSATIALLIALGALAIALRRPDIVVRDSPRFGEALDVWHPYLLSHHRPTPRTLKRYQNRIRYVAMRQRPAEPATDPLERLLHRLLRVPPAPAATEDALPEPLLVALGAVQLVDPDFLAGAVQSSATADFLLFYPGTGANDRSALAEVIERHRAHFGDASWPPSPEAVRRFLKLSEGVAIR